MNIVVAGTGYVGLVTGVALANAGHSVTCVDVDQAKVDTMRQGISPIYEPGLDELMRKNMHRLTFTTDYASAYRTAEVIFIGVGTPEKKDGSANLSYVFQVAHQIAENIENDCIVVVKSTVPIGTNDKIEKLIQENLKHPGVGRGRFQPGVSLAGNRRAGYASCRPHRHRSGVRPREGDFTEGL